MRTLRIHWLLLLTCCAMAWGACSTVETDPVAEEEPEGTLRNLARRHGRDIGAAAATGLPTSDARYADVLGREFSMLTPENAMKPGPLRPTRQTFSFAEADALVQFAEKQEMKVRGHTLVWHQALPSWMTGLNWTGEELAAILREHILTVVGRYKGRVAAWDVVNEAIADDGSLHNTIWLQAMEPEYIASAFRWAHEADPEARLFYNDYGAEGRGQKADAVFALVRGLREAGVPIHGVGLQMHVSTQWAPSPADVAANIKRLGDLGVEVHITEMDVRIPLPVTTEGLVKQAGVYANMLDVCLEAWNCTAFVLWGFTDRHSWVSSTVPGTGAALIFDENYREKLAYDALRELLAEKE